MGTVAADVLCPDCGHKLTRLAPLGGQMTLQRKLFVCLHCGGKWRQQPRIVFRSGAGTV
ncbi:MAG: hypothetical protein JWL73_2887 [Actinomycetia bacterium]|nr:hypothetical protein [Actinomycetes bacterium]